MWYQIDAVDRVAKVSSDWDITAQRNGASALIASSVIGRPIWSFLDGDAAKLHYAYLFETVRQTQNATQIRIRGDGPTRQSLLQLDIAPSPNQSLEITIKTLRDRAVSHAPIWDNSLPRSTEEIVTCSWCKAIDIGHQWTSIGHACNSFLSLQSDCPPGIVNHICPCCEFTMIRERQVSFASKNRNNRYI